MFRAVRSMGATCATAALILVMGNVADADARRTRTAVCHHGSTTQRDAPAWAKPRRMTVLVDSVLLSGKAALHPVMPCWHKTLRGRPALMVKIAERELRTKGRRVAPLVVIGLAYN